MKPGDHEDISDISRCWIAEWMSQEAAHKIDHGWSAWYHSVPALHNLVFSILFYSNSGDTMMNFTSKRHLGWLTKNREERQCESSSAAILTMHWDFLPLPQNSSGQGWTNPRYVVALIIKLHIVRPRIFSINYCNFPLFHTNFCTRSQAPNRKHHITVTFTCHSRPVSAQYSTGLTSPLWHLQFGDDF